MAEPASQEMSHSNSPQRDSRESSQRDLEESFPPGSQESSQPDPQELPLPDLQNLPQPDPQKFARYLHCAGGQIALFSNLRAVHEVTELQQLTKAVK